MTCRAAINHTPGHVTTITAPAHADRGWWWSCTCGDEGGPHESFGRTWDATVDHERAVAEPLQRRVQ